MIEMSLRKRRFPKTCTYLMLLFIFPFLIRCFWAFDLAPVPYIVPDEFLYPFAGKLYFYGLSSGDFSVFKVNAAHPPLSKLITALFIFSLGPLGFSDIQSLRMQDCFFSALTCVVMYLIGSKASRGMGLLSWALLSLDPLSIRFALASLDVTSLFFASMSMWTLLKANSSSKRSYLLPGICLGLAALCKYLAFPIVLIALTLILIKEESSLKMIGFKMSLVGFSSIVLLILGNPLFWPPQVIGFSGFQAVLGDTAGYASQGPAGLILSPLDWLKPALSAHDTPHAIFYLSMLLHGALIHPLRIFEYSFLPWVFLGGLFQLVRRNVMPIEFKSLLWFSTSFLFFWFLAKSQAAPYYGIWLEPPLAILSASILLDAWRRSRC